MPCPYANVLGSPDKGFHTHIFGVALGDIVGTAGLAYVTSRMYDVDVLNAFIGWFIVAEVSHYAFGVDTAVLKALNLSPSCKNST